MYLHWFILIDFSSKSQLDKLQKLNQTFWLIDKVKSAINKLSYNDQCIVGFKTWLYRVDRLNFVISISLNIYREMRVCTPALKSLNFIQTSPDTSHTSSPQICTSIW